MTISMTLNREMSAQSSQPRRAVMVAAVVVAAIGLVLAATFLWPREPSRSVKVEIVSAPLREQISAMSTGVHQELVVTGETAQARNAEIPISGELAKMTAFAVIPATSPQYATALKCLTQAVYYEAANEPELGKRAVAQVVINRLRHPAYPHSVCGVVYEGVNARVCQFSFTCDGALLRVPMARQWGESRSVAHQALAGFVVPEVGSATNYHADYVLPRWAFTLGKLAKIGAHVFYRFPGRIGSAVTFTSAWNGFEQIPTLNMERLKLAAAAEADAAIIPETELGAPLALPVDIKDRHAEADVGGRLDTTTGWRLQISDPVQLSASYRSAVAEQSGSTAAPTEVASVDVPVEGQARATN